MSIFNIGYRPCVYRKYLGKVGFNRESEYGEEVIIHGVINGGTSYKRGLTEENTNNTLEGQFSTEVFKQDKIDGYIVTDVEKRYTIFGSFDHWAVSLKDG